MQFLSIKERLFLVVSVPIVFLIVFIFQYVQEKHVVVQQLNELSYLVAFSKQTNVLVHELQKERGKSVSLLAKKQVSDDIQQRLQRQRKLTDLAIADYHSAKLKITPQQQQKIEIYLQRAHIPLQNLRKRRFDVDSGTISIRESVSGYTLIIDASIGIVGQLMRVVNDRDIALNLQSYRTLILAKEKAAFERGLGAALLNGGPFDQDFYIAYVGQVAAQNAYLAEFKKLAKSEHRTKLDTILQNENSRSVLKWRQALLRLGVTRDTSGINGEQWFSYATKRIEHIKLLEDEVAGDLTQQIQMKISVAEFGQMMAILIGLVAVSLALGIATILAVSIGQPLKKIAATFVGVAQGNGDKYIDVSYPVRSEIGQITSAYTKITARYEQMLSELRHTNDAAVEAKENAEAAVAELDFYKLALDEHAIVATTDTKGVIIYANDRFCKISKYDKADLIGSNHRLLTSGHHPESFFTDMYKTIAGGEVWRAEVKNRARDGSYYWVDTTITPFKDAKGKVIRYVAIRTDITDRKQAVIENKISKQKLEERTRELEKLVIDLEEKSNETTMIAEDLRLAKDVQAQTHKHLLASINSMPNGFAIWNADDRLVLANDAFRGIHGPIQDMIVVGVKLEDAMSASFDIGIWDVEGVDKRDWMAALLKDWRNTDSPEKELRCADGRQIIFVKRVLDTGDVVLTHIDVTTHREREMELQNTKQQLEVRAGELEKLVVALEEKSNETTMIAEDLQLAKDEQSKTHKHLLTSINSMPSGFIIWDADDRLVLANDAYRDLHDAIRDVIVEGCKFEDILLAGLDRGVWNTDGLSKQDWLDKQVKHRRSAPETEKELKSADGRHIIFSQRILDNGDLITNITDITTQRTRERELQDTKQQLEKIAYFDTLTGLANRAHCQKDMVEKFSAAGPDSKFAIIQIDLDNFKRVNDTLGHAAGDHLLRTLGERLSLLSREFDNFKSYRWGGDEFIGLVERDDDTDLEAICQEMTDLIAIPLEFDDTVLRPTVSLGVARYPEDALSVEELMIFSDLALYKTKELGRDGYQFFTSEMKEKIDSESKIERELRVALEEDQLELYYQPQININDESISGFEALLRWNHPERGLLAPGEFIDVAEASGLAQAVGIKVFDEAMKTIRYWVDEGFEFGRLAVNLSPEHLKKSSIMDDLFGTMDRHGIEPNHLAVEFLESFLLDDPNANIAGILDQLRTRGVHVELDDFGTGYASLSHLSTMPINGLKIDRSFVNHMVDDHKQQGIVSALISMSKLLDLRVVCEGIETRQQLDVLSQIGNCSIQGYFVSKPMSLTATTEWIRNKHNIGILGTLPDIAVA